MCLWLMWFVVVSEVHCAFEDVNRIQYVTIRLGQCKSSLVMHLGEIWDLLIIDDLKWFDSVGE